MKGTVHEVWILYYFKLYGRIRLNSDNFMRFRKRGNIIFRVCPYDRTRQNVPENNFFQIFLNISEKIVFITLKLINYTNKYNLKVSITFKVNLALRSYIIQPIFEISSRSFKSEYSLSIQQVFRTVGRYRHH